MVEAGHAAPSVPQLQQPVYCYTQLEIIPATLLPRLPIPTDMAQINRVFRLFGRQAERLKRRVGETVQALGYGELESITESLKKL